MELGDAGFQQFPKIARLSRDMVITEKIDGTNAQVFIQRLAHSALGDMERTPNGSLVVFSREVPYLVRAGSRNRWVTPEKDNFGFACWVQKNARELVTTLGKGRHFGEWWGAGIQRRYGLQEKRFSLFNVSRWHTAGRPPFESESDDSRLPGKFSTELPLLLSTVPILYTGLFDTETVSTVLRNLEDAGSVAAPGFMDPEWVVVFHVASGVSFKKTLDGDGHKGER